MNINDDNKNYITTKNILENPKYPFTKGQLDHFLLNRHKNGLDTAVRKIGKRIYLRTDLFDVWIESQATQGGKYGY